MSRQNIMAGAASLLCMALLSCDTVGPMGDMSRSFLHVYGGPGDDEGFCVRQTSDGGYVVVGSTTSSGAGGRDLYVVKTNASGMAEWRRSYGGSADDEGRSIVQTPDGGYLAVGTTLSSGAGSSDIYALRLDHNGDTLWTRTYGGANVDEANGVVIADAGGFLVAGATRSRGLGSNDFYLLRIDDNGNLLWEKAYGGVDDEVCYDLRRTPDGRLLLAGTSLTPGTVPFASRVAATVVDQETGNEIVLLSSLVGTTSGAFTAQPTTGRQFVAAGFSNGTDKVDSLLVTRVDSLSRSQWRRIGVARNFGRAGGTRAYSITATSDGGFAILGYTRGSNDGFQDMYLVRLDSALDLMWSRTYGDGADDIGRSIQQTRDGGFVIAGSSRSFTAGANRLDVALIKVDRNGELR